MPKKEKNMRTPKIEHVKEHYDSMTTLYNLVNDGDIHFGFYNDESDDIPLQEAQQRFTDMLIHKMPVKEDDHVLDIGCGMGAAGIRLSEKTGCSVTGIAISASEIEYANKNVQKAGLTDRVKFKQADFFKETFDPASFDAVWAVESLTHMDRAAALSKIYELLKPGGTFVFADGFEKNELTRKQQNICQGTFAISLFPFKMYDSLIENAGFQKIELLDITQNIQISFQKMNRMMNKKSKELEKIYGEKMANNLLTSFSSLTKVYDACIGYVMGVFRKPLSYK